ncbi:MAG: HEAT repeat domain-containing protein, partial [Myxococcota bacterium]
MPDLPQTGEGPQTGSSRADLVLGPDGHIDPQVRLVADWVLAFTKAMRGARVYAENNEMHQKFVDRAHEGLTKVLEGLDELSLSIREDRMLFEGQVVHNDPDRQEGLPFVLYRNAFRRITFTRGMSREELLELIKALNIDYGSFDFTGEDLVSTLWRLSLPHLRYVTIDALNVTRDLSDGSELDDNDVDRIQADIEAIVATIYRNASPDDDIVAGVSIGKDDLEVLRDLRSEPEEDIELLDHTTERAIADIPVGQLQTVQRFLQGDDRDALTRRMLDILVLILFKEESGSAGSATIELLQQLYDSLLLAQRYVDARGLVERLRDSSENAEDMQEIHISRHLVRLFSTDGRILPVLDGFNDGYRTVPISDMVAFLRALGPNAAPVLLQGLGNLDSAAHRKIVCDLIVEFGVPEVRLLEERTVDAKWFVVRDILELARHHPLEHITRLVREALQHEHPKVRAQAVRALRDYGPGVADELVAERLNDADSEVRIVAARVAAARQAKVALPFFEEILQDETLADRDQRELRMVLGAFATIGQGSAVESLGALLHPSFFTRLKSGADLQIAAASALGLIQNDTARAHLRKGARSLNGRVREACRRALTQTRRSIVEPSPGPRTSAPDLEVAEQLPTETMSLLTESGNSADVLFSVGPDGPTKVRAPLPTESSGDHPAHRTGPALPSVDVPHSGREELPSRLPPAPELMASEVDSADIELVDEETDEFPVMASPVERGESDRFRQESAIDAFEAAYQEARAAEQQRETPPAARMSDRVDTPLRTAAPTTDDVAPEILEYLGLNEPLPDTPQPPAAPPTPAVEVRAPAPADAQRAKNAPPRSASTSPETAGAGARSAGSTRAPSSAGLRSSSERGPRRSSERGARPSSHRDVLPSARRDAIPPSRRDVAPPSRAESAPGSGPLSDAMPLPIVDVDPSQLAEGAPRSRPFERLIQDALVDSAAPKSSPFGSGEQPKLTPFPPDGFSEEGLTDDIGSEDATISAREALPSLDIPIEAPVMLPSEPPRSAPDSSPLTPLGSEPLDPSGFGELGLPARPVGDEVGEESGADRGGSEGNITG